MKTLVIIDMQNDFVHGALGSDDARAAEECICAKLQKNTYDRVICTLDTHDPDSYAMTQEGKKLPVPHCLCETTGWELTPKIKEAVNLASVTTSRQYVRKPTFGAIYLPDHFHPDYFQHRVDKSADMEIEIVGVCTDICVVSNALLLKAHFPQVAITIDAECCAGSSHSAHRAAMTVMRSCHINIINEHYDLAS